MWHWDQGRLAYFQFDVLRLMAAYAVNHDFRVAKRQELQAALGLPFAAPATHSPWRNYGRTLKLSLLVTEANKVAIATPVAHILAKPGAITCDEYMHFLARAFTEPSPALTGTGWKAKSPVRYPLLFVLKYLLAKRAVQPDASATINEVIGAYMESGFIGDEDEASFIAAQSKSKKYAACVKADYRQARESIMVISQISYLHLKRAGDEYHLILSLAPTDAADIFANLQPIGGPKAATPEREILRLAELFKDGAQEDFYDYPSTVVNDAEQSGFPEGTKVQKTHLVIERNQELRKAFFETNPTALCDVCRLDTNATYPWTTRVLDLHHLLPLASGTKVKQSGTTFDDLVAICPSCHRAVHRFYDNWLSANDLADFPHESVARAVYAELKTTFHGAIHV